MGRRKTGSPPMSEIEKEIQRAVTERECKQRQKVYQDMAKYRVNRKRLAAKIAAARAAGLSYGYYVALVVERRGRLSIM